MKNRSPLLRRKYDVLFAVTVVAIQWAVSCAWGGTVELNGHVFTLPDGYSMELVAASPLVDRPINAAFDDQGRLYVTDSSGTNEKVLVQLEQKPHRIMRLEDTNGDGVFDKSNVFADSMSFPEGAMWSNGSLYVAAPPSIWKLTDTDGDGVADQRSEWYQGKTITGCANDLHGPYAGLDGWIYWCKGAFAEQSHEVNGRPWTTRASHLFRSRPDGSGLEPVMTGGMDNPVDAVMIGNGERFISNTFLVHPANGTRDGIIHAVYGSVFGKEHGVLDGHPRTGELMPIMSLMGAAAPSGMVAYESEAFGREFTDNLFMCQFNLHKISRHQLLAKGASYSSIDSDFVVSNHIDFHPTDVIEDADGSLLIVDTGGWYKLCCPSSQLHKPDVLGAIYRVRKMGARLVVDPRGVQINYQSLASLDEVLSDARPQVRWQATTELARRLSDPAHRSAIFTARAESLRKFVAAQGSGEIRRVTLQQRHALWASMRVESDETRQWARDILEIANDPETRWRRQVEEVLPVALHAISLHRDQKAASLLWRLLDGTTNPAQRLIVECLGRLGDPASTSVLLETAALMTGESSTSIDRHLEHAVIYALLELNDHAGLASHLNHDSAMVRRVAMLALDQLPGQSVTPEAVLPLLTSADPMLRRTAEWLAARHPDWGKELSAWASHALSKGTESHLPENLESLIASLTRQADMQQTLADLLQPTSTAATRQRVAHVMMRAPLTEPPASWSSALVPLIQQHDATAIQLAKVLPRGKTPHAELIQALLAAGESSTLSAEVRLTALAASGASGKLSNETWQLIGSSLSGETPVTHRALAAEAAASATPAPDQTATWLAMVSHAGPLEINRLIEPVERVRDDATVMQLLDTLKTADALESLRLDSLRSRLAKRNATILKAIDELELRINVDATAQRERIEALLPLVEKGDIRRGQAVFLSAKAACTSCHRLGYFGSYTGPDLTRIGNIRTERDLLESILYPSLSFVRSFEPVVIVTSQGQVINGLIRSESAEDLLLHTGPNQEVRIATKDIDERRPSTVSVMPAGMDKQLTEQELADLVRFLKDVR